MVISVTILVKGTPRVSLWNVISGTVSLKLVIGIRILFGSHMSVNDPLFRVGILGYLLLSLQANQVPKDLESAQGSKE